MPAQVIPAKPYRKPTDPHRLSSCYWLILAPSLCIHFVFAFLLPTGNIQLNLGPPTFTICTLNIRSILLPMHSAAPSDLIDTQNPNLFCLIETWIRPITTSDELMNCTVPNYTLLGVPRNDSSNISQASSS